jgi:tetratricopeptide (TPR) repeat protein
VGLRLIEDQKISEALKIFELNSKRYPKADLAYQNILSLILIRDGNGIEKLSADLVRRNQKDQSIGIYDMDYLGDRLLNAGLTHEALELFRLNTKLFPDAAGVYESLGDAYRTLGDKKAASGCYEKALQLNPGDRGVEEKLKRLENK